MVSDLGDLAVMVVSLVMALVIVPGGLVLLYGMQLDHSETPWWKLVVFFAVWGMPLLVIGDLMTNGFTAEFVAYLPLALAVGAILGAISGLVVPPLAHHIYRENHPPASLDDQPRNP
jgi:hypothetical protein